MDKNLLKTITSKIYIIRKQKVMLDRDLAELYGIETKTFKRAVRRNIERFPKDFMFELTKEETKSLRYQFDTSSWGGSRYQFMAFSEQGVAMLSSVLRSKKAIKLNIQIMRIFIELRQIVIDNKEFKKEFIDFKKETDLKLQLIFNELFTPKKVKKKNKIGF